LGREAISHRAAKRRVHEVLGRRDGFSLEKGVAGVFSFSSPKEAPLMRKSASARGKENTCRNVFSGMGGGSLKKERKSPKPLGVSGLRESEKGGKGGIEKKGEG